MKTGLFRPAARLYHILQLFFLNLRRFCCRRMWAKKPEDRPRRKKYLHTGSHRVMVGHRCLITHGSEHLAREYGKSFSGKSEGTALKVTKIGNKVFLGMNAILLSGILIGERAVPDPGTMISREVPSWIVAAGSPMRFVKKYDPVLRKWVVYKGESGIL